jgi:hypothetical protein
LSLLAAVVAVQDLPAVVVLAVLKQLVVFL